MKPYRLGSYIKPVKSCLVKWISNLFTLHPGNSTFRKFHQILNISLDRQCLLKNWDGIFQLPKCFSLFLSKDSPFSWEKNVSVYLFKTHLCINQWSTILYKFLCVFIFIPRKISTKHQNFQQLNNMKNENILNKKKVLHK